MGITIWPFIIVRKDTDEVTVNHERIHHQQQDELLVIGFYVLYLIWHIKYGYKNNPLEIEAFDNEKDMGYLDQRKMYNYFKKK